MYSIIFEVGPNLDQFEATGYSSESLARYALESSEWFTNYEGNIMKIPRAIINVSIAFIRETK